MARNIAAALCSVSSYSLSGTLPADVLPTGKQTVVNFGGFTKVLVDKKEFKASKPKDGVTKFTIAVKSGNISASLADEGLNKTDSGAKKVSVIVMFNDKIYTKTLDLTYKAVSGKSGSAK